MPGTCDICADTDILIHLFKSGHARLLFDRFDHVHYHAWLYDNELLRHGKDVTHDIETCIDDGDITVYTETLLTEMGINSLFTEYMDEHELLFDSGEQYAIALARTLGVPCLATDDIKDFGPYDTAIKGSVKNIVPWAFHDLLFLEFMMEDSSLQTMEECFKSIAKKAFNPHPPRFQSRMNRIIRRFRKQARPEDISFLDEYFDIGETTLLNKTDDLMRYIRKIKS